MSKDGKEVDKAGGGGGNKNKVKGDKEQVGKQKGKWVWQKEERTCMMHHKVDCS